MELKITLTLPYYRPDTSEAVIRGKVDDTK